MIKREYFASGVCYEKDSPKQSFSEHSFTFHIVSWFRPSATQVHIAAIDLIKSESKFSNNYAAIIMKALNRI